MEGDPAERFVNDLIRRVRAGAKVLDIGCGPGLPSTRRLAEHFEVTGVDMSATQLQLARQNVPSATFIRSDVLDASFTPHEFAAVTALYVVSHLPREQQARLFHRVSEWLEPGGLFLVTLGAGELPDWTGDWLGVPMFFSSNEPEVSRRDLRATGFELLEDEIVEMREPEGQDRVSLGARAIGPR